MTSAGAGPVVRCERYPGRGPTVRLLHADAVDALAMIAPSAPRLAYLDPPFATARDFSLSCTLPDELGGERIERVAYTDRWDDLDAYLGFMDELLGAVEAALHPDGSLLLHCDHRAAPYLAVMCDRRFGMGARGADAGAPGYRNELVWRYGLGGSSARAWPRKHDTILWYTRGERWTFHPPMVPATSQRMRGQLKKAPDVIDVPALNNLAAERTGYPTQKPQALLELLVGAHSDADDRIIDVCCGSGTTGAAAWTLGRPATLADRGDDAIAATRTRLVRDGAALEIERACARERADDDVVQVEARGALARLTAAPDAPLVFVASGDVHDAEFRATSLPCVASRSPGGMLAGATTSLEIEPAGSWLLWRDVHGREGILRAPVRD